MGQYYYLDGADPIGPFSLQDIYTLIDREVVGPATMVCREGGADWLLLHAVPELKGKALASALTRVVPPEALPVGGTSPGESRRRTKKYEVNVTGIIVAFLLSVVAIYITYTISHVGQESAQADQEINRLLGR